ncbi:hypothetical protein BYT27DRAFT_7127747 [Phlegmacium glaucopus]|nr:hypothetical protein BYT27DRAFT_7127747 [Phlegmacium glaucopus]
MEAMDGLSPDFLSPHPHSFLLLFGDFCITMFRDIATSQVRVVNYVLTSIAVVVTCLRLWDRARSARLWWDDAWALITMLFLVTFMAVVEVHLQDPDKHSMGVKLVVAYMCEQFFYAVTWSARLSILLTVIRLSFGRFRRYLVYAGVLFVIIWLILFAQIWWVCENKQEWKKSNAPQCPIGLEVAVAQVITDIACDAILIFAPLRLVWKTRLSRAQKIRLMSLFSTTIITTIVSMNHAYFVLKTGGLPEALAAVIQCTVSLIVANLSVIIAFFFRITTEEHDTILSGPSGIPTTHFFSFSRRAAVGVPITSTFITTNGSIRQRSDTYSAFTDLNESKMTHSYQDQSFPGSVRKDSSASVSV